MVKRLIEWIVGGSPDKGPVGRTQSGKVRGNIFLGRDLDKPKPDSCKVVRWVDSPESGTETR
jgi:hypothetical protein